MRRSALFFLFLFSGLILFWPFPAQALKQRFTPGGGTSGMAKKASLRLGVASTVRLRPDRRAVIMTLSDLGKASQVSYALTYTGSGVPQGVSGIIKPSGKSSVRRELVFGTCSAGVCRYHTGIANARLVITTYLKDGRKVNKVYRIKV